MPVIILARIKAKAGCERQLKRAIRAMIATVEEKESAARPRYTLYRCSEDPALLILLERHDGDPASDSDGDAGELIENLAGLIDGRPILETLIDVADD
jgi:hypothetical protein